MMRNGPVATGPFFSMDRAFCDESMLRKSLPSDLIRGWEPVSRPELLW